MPSDIFCICTSVVINIDLSYSWKGHLLITWYHSPYEALLHTEPKNLHLAYLVKENLLFFWDLLFHHNRKRPNVTGHNDILE